MKAKDKLWNEFWEIKNKKHSNRIVSAINIHQLFDSDKNELMKEMLTWAYKQGFAKGKENKNGR